jgi:hypothetical protein
MLSCLQTEAVFNLSACLDSLPRIVGLLVGVPSSKQAQAIMDDLASRLAGIIPIPCVVAALAPPEMHTLQSLCVAGGGGAGAGGAEGGAAAVVGSENWIRLLHTPTSFMNSRL